MNLHAIALSAYTTAMVVSFWQAQKAEHGNTSSAVGSNLRHQQRGGNIYTEALVLNLR